jgi:hypothetical protein
MGWVICAETFLMVMTFSYITMMCFTHPAPEQGVVEPSATQVSENTEVALEAMWSGVSPEVKEVPEFATRRHGEPKSEPRDEKSTVCEQKNNLAKVLAAFVVAFMAGGFMNVERIQGLPVP